MDWTRSQAGADQRMRRWNVALLLAVILLPAFIFVALRASVGYESETEAIEAAALARADAIMAAVDGDIQRTRASALVLSTIPWIKHEDWHGAYVRAKEIAALNPDWRTVRLADLRKHTELFDLTTPFGAPRKLAGQDLAAVLEPLAAPIAIGSVQRTGKDCPCVIVRVPILQGGQQRYVLTILLDPAAMQQLLRDRAPREGVSGVVDAHGNFIARTLDYARRVGTPGTIYLRRASKAGRSGIYTGITYEGLANHSAFSTSPLTGWSTHVAVPSTRFDMPTARSRIATTAAILASMVLAGGLGLALIRVGATQRRADVRLMHAQRLETIGMMAGGIAHDFNNMLATIVGSVEMAQRRVATGRTDIDRYLTNAIEGAMRGGELTRRLLAFSRRQTLEPAIVDVGALLTDMHALLAQTLGESVRLTVTPADGLWCSIIDPMQLANAILNLAANAHDAMPSGGHLHIACVNIVIDARHGEMIDLAPGDYVQVYVADDGAGMPPDVMAHAFDPFFTTKEVGRGTGLGLSQVCGFMEQSGGRATIASAEGKGTTITLYLPRHNGAATDRPSSASNPVASLPGGSPGEIILVVEDEQRVRCTSVEALRELGYTVREAADGMQALQILEGSDDIRLLFTDIVMPGMHGRELADAARRLQPGLKTLLTTGYEREGNATRINNASERDILRKPFTLAQLAQAIRTVLDSAP